MKYFKDLNEEEQFEVYNKAWTFIHDHSEYVSKMLIMDTPSVAPSGSDMFKPELWKEIHWSWYFTVLLPNYRNESKYGIGKLK